MLLRVGIDHLLKSVPEIEVSPNSHKEIDSVLTSAFNDYGIESAWIKKSINKKDSCEFFKIQVPGDLPVPVLINGISKKISDLDINVTARELEVNGKTTANLKIGKKIICRTEFIVDKLLVRKAASFGFILNRFYELSESKRAIILGIPEKFAAVLIPSQDCEKMKDKIISAEKEYIILLDDNITESRFKMEEDFTPKRIKDAITDIINIFGGAKLFLIDDNSTLSKSAIYKLISNEFSKRNLQLVKISRYRYIEETGDLDFHSILKKICENSTSGESKAFVVYAGDFDKLVNEIEEFRNRGYKFILPSSFNFSL